MTKYVLGAAAAALFATATVSAGTGAWVDLFAPPYQGVPTITMAISCVAEDLCFVAGGENGAGFDVFRYDGKPGGNFAGEMMPSKPMMIMGVGMGGTAAAPAGAAGGMGFGNGVQYLKNMTTYLPSKTQEFMVTSQDVVASKDGKNVLVIDQAGQGIVLASADGGANFIPRTVDIPLPGTANCTEIRYGSIVDDKTFYVTFGTWPAGNRSNSAADVVHRVSERVAMHRQADGSVKRVSSSVGARAAEQELGGSGSGSASSSSGSSGPPPAPSKCQDYAAAIAKTTDGGLTWTSLISTASNYYFNAIDCHTADHCIAVAEGFNEGGAARIFMTTNGKDFKEVLTVPMTKVAVLSFMSVKFTSATEAWVGGSNERTNNAAMYHTTDGGNTWAEYAHALPNIVDISSMSFLANGVGFVTAQTEFQDSTILKFEPKGTPVKYFAEVQCPFKGCTALCHTAKFPEGQCLKTSGGGSALATCKPTVLSQQMFANSTDCTGASSVQTMPLNKCLKDAQGSYFEVQC